MKRFFSVFLAALLLMNCSVFVHAESMGSEFCFTRENFPTLDGSTSMVPLGEAIASVLLGETREEAADLIHFNRTTQSFRNLRSGECDVVIAAEPKSEVFDEMRDGAFPYLLETIAKEALVFVVNESNPVNSLTREQVRDIYSGKITNWKDVGGEDMPIEAFQRNPTAGSQVMMEKLVMEGTPMMEAPATRVPQEMGQLIEAVRSYDHSANAIGYTVFYYATDMQMAKGLKILQINGILPSAESIRTEEYPFINGYYCCISAQAPKQSPAYRLFDWLVSDAGQALLTLEGYVSVSQPGQAAHSGADIHTDYANYTPNGGTAAKYTEFDCPKDHLEPSDAYGLIYPYEGAQVYSDWGDKSYDFRAGSIRGFYNHRGELITDPVFSSIEYLSLDGWTGNQYVWMISQDGEHFGFAAKDGSFVSELCYASIYAMGSTMLCWRDYENHTFDLYDSQLQKIASQEDFRFGELAFVPSEHAAGMYCGSLYDPNAEDPRYALISEDGNILMDSDLYISLSDDGFISCYDENWTQKMYDSKLNPVYFDDLDRVDYVYHFCDRFFQVQTLDGEKMVTDIHGAIFDRGFDSSMTYAVDAFAICRGEFANYYNYSGRLIYRDIPKDWDYLGLGIFAESTDDAQILHKLPGDATLEISNGSYSYRCGDVIAVCCYDRNTWGDFLVDTDLNLLPDFCSNIYCQTDYFSGSQVLIACDVNGFSGEQRILTPDGKTELFRANGSVLSEDGCFTVADDWAFTTFAKDGSVIFCYPYYGLATGD